jgi:hypothetical protein
MEKLIITPKTKVLQLIEAYPELEDVLIEYAPAFKKLKNSVLRKTVGRIATLQQAASVGEVNVEDLINRLRKEVGQELLSVESGGNYTTQKPSWFDPSKIVSEFDVREMLKAGEQPVNQVISDLKKLNAGEIYKMTAPFLPAPLIDKATSLNFEHWVHKHNDQEYEVYFYQ